MGRTREELEAECCRLQFLWEEELFSEQPRWEELSQLELELEGAERALAELEWKNCYEESSGVLPAGLDARSAPGDAVA
jgi:hypothetical protein